MGTLKGVDTPEIASLLAKALDYRRRLAADGRLDMAADAAYRLVNEAGDGMPGIAVDIVAGYAFVHVYEAPWRAHLAALARSLRETAGAAGVYAADRTRSGESRATFLEGSPAEDDKAVVREASLRFAVQFAGGPAYGLYLDQRDNRPKAAALAAGTSLLNTFSYTCSFSVYAAAAGARTVNVDQSKLALETGKRNLALNGLSTEGHRFLADDVFACLPRLAKKGEKFGVVLLDPPTFARGKKGVFSVERDYAKLVAAAAPLVAPGGHLLAFANTHRMAHAEWYAQVRAGLGAEAQAFSEVERWKQAPDFRETGAGGYLKNAVLKRKG